MMRKYKVFAALALVLSLIIGIQFMTAQAGLNVIGDVDIDPDTLNLKSKGKFVTVYIELLEGHNVADIDLETVRLEGIPAITDQTYVFVTDPDSYLMDHDGDGILERMVRFYRTDVIGLLIQHMSPHAGSQKSLEVWGELFDGSIFRGSDTIKVLNMEP